MNHPLITTISMLAVVVSVTCNIPQLVTMLRKRSSSGQSILGWGLGFTANFALVFVNGFGYHSPVLVTGNVLSATACVTAMCLVRLYRGKPAASPATAPGAVVTGRAGATHRPDGAAAPNRTAAPDGTPGDGGPTPDSAATAMPARPITRELPATVAPVTASVPVAPPPAFAHTVTDMRTQEFVLLRDAVVAEHRRRTGERSLALA